jgi:hypothetical protein
MTQQHPITPPQELRDKWLDEAPNTSVYDYLIDSAARWGSDQELDACCEWLMLNGYGTAISRLRAARRPKPPSLKKQALEALKKIEDNEATYLDSSIIHRALEQLDD